MSGQMSIQAILGEFHFPADEPFCERGFPFDHLAPALSPDQFVSLARPELVRALDRLAIHPLILREILDPRFLGELPGRLEKPLLLQVRFDVSVFDLHSRFGKRTLTIHW